jgi:tRNA-dihydrouridine synthase A
LSPKENRTIPPLDYPRVYRLAERLAPFPVSINGGIETLAEIDEHLQHVSGVMLGRAAYHEPTILADVDHRYFGEVERRFDLAQVVTAMADYAEGELSRGTRLNSITRHMLGLANGRPGARTFRQILSVEAAKRGAGPEILLRAVDALGERRAAAA